MKKFIVHLGLFDIKSDEVISILNKLKSLKGNDVFTLSHDNDIHIYEASKSDEISYYDIDNDKNYDIDCFYESVVCDNFNLDEIYNNESTLCNLISEYISNSINGLFDVKKRCCTLEFLP